jgi:hypothetical protein
MITSSYVILQLAKDKLRFRLSEWGAQNPGRDWDFFRPCGVKGPTVVHSSDIQETYQRMNCTNLVNRVTLCPHILDGTYASGVRTLKCI